MLPELPPKVPLKKQNVEVVQNRLRHFRDVVHQLLLIPGILTIDPWYNAMCFWDDCYFLSTRLFSVRLDFIDEPDEDWAAVLMQAVYRR